MCECVCISVSVGYEYESCSGVILWERRTALMQGFELVPSNLGGWSLDKHHALNLRSGERTKNLLFHLYFLQIFFFLGNCSTSFDCVIVGLVYTRVINFTL